MMTDSFSLYFGMLRDPRQTAKISYSLFDDIHKLRDELR